MTLIEQISTFIDENYDLFSVWLNDNDYPLSLSLRKNFLVDFISSFFRIPSGKKIEISLYGFFFDFYFQLTVFPRHFFVR